MSKFFKIFFTKGNIYVNINVYKHPMLNGNRNTNTKKV